MMGQREGNDDARVDGRRNVMLRGCRAGVGRVGGTDKNGEGMREGYPYIEQSLFVAN